MTTPILGIVADDLTGAIATAGALASHGLSSVVSFSLFHRAEETSPEVLCCNTQTRNLPSSRVTRHVRAATRHLLRQDFHRLYKKVDSTLRGHVGVEVNVVAAESRAPIRVLFYYQDKQRQSWFCQRDWPNEGRRSAPGRMARGSSYPARFEGYRSGSLKPPRPEATPH